MVASWRNQSSEATSVPQSPYLDGHRFTGMLWKCRQEARQVLEGHGRIPSRPPQESPQ